MRLKVVVFLALVMNLTASINTYAITSKEGKTKKSETEADKKKAAETEHEVEGKLKTAQAATMKLLKDKPEASLREGYLMDTVRTRSKDLEKPNEGNALLGIMNTLHEAEQSGNKVVAANTAKFLADFADALYELRKSKTDAADGIEQDRIAAFEKAAKDNGKSVEELKNNCKALTAMFK